MEQRYMKWNNGVTHARDDTLQDRTHVLSTHRASIEKAMVAALAALDPPRNVREMRHVVENCRMKLVVLMDEANAAAWALDEAVRPLDETCGSRMMPV
jgi:transcriptional regulator of acetoin/glycerol metabolism